MTKNEIIKSAKAEEAYAVSVRRHIHENPELSGVEFNTLSFIKGELNKFDIPFVEVENGGILAEIRGTETGRTVLLRGDIDALPIKENPYNLCRKKDCVSKTDGVAHVCGHDAHTAMLLTTGKILASRRKGMKGNVILLFERGEEGGGNLRYLIDYMQKNNYKIDACFGMHVNAETKSNLFAIRRGIMMAGAFVYDITINGKGGHGSRPDLTNNPVDCFVAVQNGLNTIRMRAVDPNYPITFSTCKLDGEKGFNVIGSKLTFGGTVRFFDTDKAYLPFVSMMKTIIDNTAEAYGCTADYNKFDMITVPLFNNDICYDIAREALVDIFGEDSIIPGPLKYGSETMAYLMSYYPGMYLNMGIRNEESGSGAGHHTAEFDIDEGCLKSGVMANLSYVSHMIEYEGDIPFVPSTQSIWELSQTEE